MARATKKKAKEAAAKSFSLFDDTGSTEIVDDQELPRDEVGRQKIKKQYVDLLGIRVDKLKGRILNRERINKNLEGIYFICVRCAGVCHNLDEGLIEDEKDENNMCRTCSEAPVVPVPEKKPPTKSASLRKRKAAKKKTAKTTKATKTTKKVAATKAQKKTPAKKKATATPATKKKTTKKKVAKKKTTKKK